MGVYHCRLHHHCLAWRMVIAYNILFLASLRAGATIQPSLPLKPPKANPLAGLSELKGLYKVLWWFSQTQMISFRLLAVCGKKSCGLRAGGGWGSNWCWCHHWHLLCLLQYHKAFFTGDHHHAWRSAVTCWDPCNSWACVQVLLLMA